MLQHSDEVRSMCCEWYVANNEGGLVLPLRLSEALR